MRRFRTIVDAILERLASERLQQRLSLEWQTRELALITAAASGSKELVERAARISMDPERNADGTSAKGDKYGRPPGPNGLPFDPEAEIDYESIKLPNAAQGGILLRGLTGPRHG